MEYFNYVASDAKGAVVRGRLIAADKRELAKDLEKENLLLISATVDLVDPDEGPDPPAPVVTEPVVARSNGFWHDLRALTATQQALLALILCVGILGAWRINSKRVVPPTPTSPLHIDLSRIRPHMSRREIEKILPTRLPDRSNPSRTRYRYSADKIVEIRYDQTGGPWSGDNRKQGQGILIIHLTDINHPPVRSH